MKHTKTPDHKLPMTLESDALHFIKGAARSSGSNLRKLNVWPRSGIIKESDFAFKIYS